jgi:hypothetical protein
VTRDRPLGFVLLAVPLCTLTLMLFLLLLEGTRREPSAVDVLVNLLLVAWATLAGTATAALWRMERWAGRILAWTMGVSLAIVAAAMAAEGTPAGVMAMVLAAGALLAAAVLFYVRLRLEAIHSAPSAGRAAARRRWS